MIPEDKNLSNEEIDIYLKELVKFILKQIEKQVPKISPSNSMNKYLNKNIIKLYNRQSELIAQLNKTKKQKQPVYLNMTRMIQNAIYKTKNDLKKKFAIACRSCWPSIARKVNHKDPAKYSSIINQVFRYKSLPPIQTLKIPSNRIQLLKTAKINIDSAQKMKKMNIS